MICYITKFMNIFKTYLMCCICTSNSASWYPFFTHLRQRLKWAFLIVCPLSVIVVVVVVNFSHFHLLLQNHRTNFNQTWHKASLGEGIQVCSNEGYTHKSSREPSDQFQLNLAQSIPGWRGHKFLQIKDHIIFKKENVIFFF